MSWFHVQLISQANECVCTQRSYVTQASLEDEILPLQSLTSQLGTQTSPHDGAFGCK